MNHFLSRLGRSAVGRNLMPALSFATLSGYMALHTISHDFIRKIFVAQESDGMPVPISDYLRDLITEVFKEVDKAGYHEDKFSIKTLNISEKPTIRWFTSSTLDPVVFGMTDFKTGVSIGVPNSYNYHHPGELPDRVFVVKKLAIIRSPQGRELEEQQKAQEEIMITKREKEPTVLVRRIDKRSAEGQEYMNSLILSEDAKKFSVARELYVADSLRPFLQSGVITLALGGALAAGRANVYQFKLKERHITQRLPGYALAGLLGYGLYMFLSYAVDDYIARQANEKAKKLGDSYESGAKEYFEKQAVRDRILGKEDRKFF